MRNRSQDSNQERLFLLPLGKGLDNAIFYYVYRDIIFIILSFKYLPHKEFRISNYLNTTKVVLDFLGHWIQTAA